MIRIYTSADGARNYEVPLALRDVAVELYPSGEGEVGAIFSLARRLVCSDLVTCEQIALNIGHAEAVAFARDHLVERNAKWPQPAARTADCH